MDKLRKLRAPERAMVTKQMTNLAAEISKKAVDIDMVMGHLNILERHVEKLTQLDDKIKEVMLDQEEMTVENFEEECVAMDEYTSKVTLLKVKVDAVLNSGGRCTLSPTSPTCSGASSPRSRTIRLPKIELKKFGGELIEWLGWWAQFQKIDEDDDLHPSDKFTYLIQSMKDGTRAMDLVSSYPQSSDNYPKVIKALKERYGSQKLLKQVYVRQLIHMIIIKSKEKVQLHTLYDKLESHLRSLESLGVTMLQMEEFLYPMVESSLPDDILLAWQRSTTFGQDAMGKEPPVTKLQQLMIFLKSEIDLEEQRRLAKNEFTVTDNKKPPKNKSTVEDYELPTAAGLFSGINPKQICIFCDKNHESRDCLAATKLTLDERKKKVQDKGVCFLCIKPGHISKKCRFKTSCPICTKRHLPIFCNKSAEQDALTVQTSVNCTSEVILRTLMVKLVNPRSGKSKAVRAVIDCCSQRSYVLKRTADELNFMTTKKINLNHVLFGGKQVSNQIHNLYDIELQHINGQFLCKLIVLDQNQICGVVPRVDLEQIHELKRKGIVINDVNSSDPQEISILIGADYLGKLLTGRIEQLDSGLTATETKLGWCLMGKQEKIHGTLTMSIHSMAVSSSTVTELWRLDTIGIRDPVEIKTQEEQDKLANDHFINTVRQCDDGRYEVSLPWVSKFKEMPSNYQVSVKRLENTTKKLMGSGMYNTYHSVFKDWETEGVIFRVANDDNKSGHYLPHRAVFKDSKTTPVRPVFDASCRVGRNPCLNDCLQRRPNLLDVIPSLLTKFRLGKIGVSADIKRAFLQISINEQDRHYLKFLWWETDDQTKMVTYQHNRVVFGMNCSPFLLAAVIRHHLSKIVDEKKEVADQILSSIYVDNCILSLNSQAELENFNRISRQLMLEARMELTQWEWSGDNSENPITSILGMKWNKVTDNLFYSSIPAEPSQLVTKRLILSRLHQLFDPMGFLCPTTIVPKRMIQKAWEEKKDWDSELSEDLKVEFNRWWHELAETISQFMVPRCVTSEAITTDNSELHSFSDASKTGYAAAVFLRTHCGNQVTVNLIEAKARVAPLKAVTIPRMELLGCTISTRLVESVRKALPVKVPVRYWTDSSTALSWIKKNCNWGTFVGNRVREILHLSCPSDWDYIPTEYNPADLPSRGIFPRKFSETKWWEGPTWLKREKCEWPNFKPAVNEEEVQQEMKKTSLVMTAQVEKMPWYVSKSKFTANVFVFAYVLRFIDALKKKLPESREMSVEELNRAEFRLLKLVQNDVFPDGLGIGGLQAKKGQDNLWRVHTKLTNRKDDIGFKSPVLLPSQHIITKLIIKETHEQFGHAGIQFTMGILREKFWILHGRQAVKRVITSCVVCRRFSAKRAETEVAALPADRVRDSTAFETTGIDLAGPLTLKDKSKCWIVLFTCAVFRCVHFELVESLSTQDFLLAFTRFTMRRRRPATIYSDNGTNFRGANNLFNSINWNMVQEKTRLHRIIWKFSPPAAPWWGGWWERLIRSAKDLLKRMLGHGKLNFAELETCICQVEWIMNNRPLTFITEDLDDLVPLTPAMFMYQMPATTVPEIETVDIETLVGRKRSLDKLFDELKDRFRKEYLSMLIHRGNEVKTRQFKVGELVLIEREDQKRILWPMGIITELLPGADAKVRVAKVRTKNGVLIRPIRKLYPLEVTNDPYILTKAKGVSKTAVEETSTYTRFGRVIRKPVRFCEY